MPPEPGCATGVVPTMQDIRSSEESRSLASAVADARVRQLRMAYENSRFALFPHLISSLCYAGMLAGSVARDTLAMWLVLMIVVIVLRGLLIFAFRRPDASLERWRVWQFVLMAVFGSLYGMTALWVPLSDQAWQMAVINLWLGGLSVAAIMGQGIVASLGFAFAVPALTPMVGRLLFGTEPLFTALAVGNLLFFLYVCSIVIRTQRFTLSEIQQRVLFETMAARLDTQRTHSEALVERLTKEVARRKRIGRALRDARDLARRQSEQDQLTELPNRRILERKLRQAWLRARQERLPVSLILCDVDRFRAYNDRYGHHAGDLCLSRLAKLIARQANREGDVVARFGGEEFAVLLPDTGEYSAIHIADAIRCDVFDQTILHGTSDTERVVTVSCGVATIIPGAGEDESSLLEAAALALKRAKFAGRNCVYTLFGNVASDGQ